MEIPMRFFAKITVFGFFVVILVASCRNSQTREPSSGRQQPIPSGTGANQTLEECNDRGLAWIAVAQGDSASSMCGGQLASWGCCEAQVMSRYPSMVSALSEKFSQKHADGMTLYNCERDPQTQAVKLHFVKYDPSGQVTYSHLSFTAFMEEPSTDVQQCPRTPSIPNRPPPSANPSQGLGSGFGGNLQNSSPLKFDEDIQPIMGESCANGACHTDSTGTGRFAVDELTFFDQREKIRDRICRSPDRGGMMPPAGWGSNEQGKAALLQFIGQLSGDANPATICDQI